MDNTIPFVSMLSALNLLILIGLTLALPFSVYMTGVNDLFTNVVFRAFRETQVPLDQMAKWEKW